MHNISHYHPTAKWFCKRGGPWTGFHLGGCMKEMVSEKGALKEGQFLISVVFH